MASRSKGDRWGVWWEEDTLWGVDMRGWVGRADDTRRMVRNRDDRTHHHSDHRNRRDRDRMDRMAHRGRMGTPL